MQETEKRGNKDQDFCNRFSHLPQLLSQGSPNHKETLHCAYLAYTRRRTREPKAGQRGGKTVRGEKTQGRKQRLRSRPLMQQTPVLHCDRCPFLWNGEHVLVLLAVDCIGWLFCVSKRRNVTEPRDRWGLYGLWQARDPCARSLATSPHGQDTEQQPDSNDSRQHQYMLIIP